MKISIISPVYNAEEIVDELCAQIISAVEGCEAMSSYEIILVDDRSRDNSWLAIKSLSTQNDSIRGIRLSRNFGQHPAITAGLIHSHGDVVVVIDCDLQDNPAYISDMLAKIDAGFDFVLTRREKRNFGLWKNITASIYNGVLNYFSSGKLEYGDSRVGSFSMLSRKVVDAYNDMNDYHRHYLMILKWLGFSVGYIDVVHNKRYSGKSSYTLSRLLDHALVGITANSNKLLYISVILGFVIAFISVLAGFFLILSYFSSGYMNGWTSLIVSIFFSLGVILVSLGILGVYIGRVFDQVRSRPIYVVSDVID